ncbi:hypothetical protein C8R44DRAFT_985739 [Mycena epipterygia]|nr:hypothetical protein C8R44DRAFT_985739 [Mycena epipterygia]
MPDYYEVALPVGYQNGCEYEEEYTPDLISGLAEAPYPTPTPSYLKRPRLSPSPSAMNLRRRSARQQMESESERDCGICFEPATSPVRTLCCAHLFCAEHIAQWLLVPAADGRCPACRAPCSFAFGDDTLLDKRKGLLALDHPPSSK